MDRRVTEAPEFGNNDFLEAAIELFQTKGFERTAVIGITNEAGVSHGTIFNSCKMEDGILHGIEEVLVMDVRFVKA